MAQQCVTQTYQDISFNMKILSKKEVKSVKNTELDKVKVISDYISRRTKELNIFKLDIQKQKQVILEEFLRFQEDLLQRKDEIQNSVSSLETKRDMAFNALSRLSFEAEDKFRLAKEIENKTSIKEQNISQREAKIETRNNEIDEREQILNTRALSLSKRSEVIAREEGELENLKIKNNTEFITRESKVKRQEQSISERLNELSLSAQANVKTAELLKEREKEFEEYMKKEKALLADGRETLARAFANLKSKQK